MPTEIFTALLALAVSGQCVVIWYLVRQVGKLASRLARMETAMEIRWGLKMKHLKESEDE